MDNILVTGASGMLGGCLYKKLKKNYKTTGICFNNPQKNLCKLDISDKDATEKFITSKNFACIIHCAAIRSPDYCLNNPEIAEKVNTIGSENIAKAAEKVNAYLIYISTDYVFAGDNAPYKESDTPTPINLYGKTKLDGEIFTQKVKNHLIVRIPALFRTDLEDDKSFVTALSKQFSAGNPIQMDNKTVRYYTSADDISDAIIFLMEKEEKGIIHLTSNEKTSKADFARKVGKELGYEEDSVLESQPQISGDKRPLDSHLDSSYYESLKGPALRPFSEVIKEIPNQKKT